MRQAKINQLFKTYKSFWVICNFNKFRKRKRQFIIGFFDLMQYLKFF